GARIYAITVVARPLLPLCVRGHGRHKRIRPAEGAVDPDLVGASAGGQYRVVIGRSGRWFHPCGARCPRHAQIVVRAGASAAMAASDHAYNADAQLHLLG
ncbi:MAG: hypothetical protein ACRDTT_02670, partial [Pseudonocardiaceae bacterium]